MICVDEGIYIDNENPQRKDNLIIDYIRLKTFIEFSNENKVFLNDIKLLGKELVKLNTDYYDELDYKTIEKMIINYQYLLGVRISNIMVLNNMISSGELITIYKPYREMYNIHYSKSFEELNTKVLRRKNDRIHSWS